MTTYKEKYHLKKTQPLFNKQRISYLNYIKEPAKPEKASTLKNIQLKKKSIKDKISNHASRPNQRQKLNSQQNQQQNNQISKFSMNIQDQTKSTQMHRPHSMSVVRKVDLSNNKSLEYWKKGPMDNFNFNIISSVQNFFNKIIKPDNGCVCQQPCVWAEKLFKWVDIPEFLVNQHYQSLRQKVHQKSTKRNNGMFDYLLDPEAQEKNDEKQKSFKQIRKDIDRTHSQSLTFQNSIFKRRLQNILKCYVIEDIKVGYVQGMNMILAGILYHIKEQAKSYGIFRKLLYSIRSIYLDNFKDCYLHVNRIEELLKANLFDVHQLLQQMQIELSMICLPWIISLLTSIVPLEYVHLIYNGFIKQRWNFIYKISLSIFIYFKDQIKQSTDGSEILTLLASSQDNYKQIDWQDIVKYGENLDVSMLQSN